VRCPLIFRCFSTRFGFLPTEVVPPVRTASPVHCTLVRGNFDSIHCRTTTSTSHLFSFSSLSASTTHFLHRRSSTSGITSLRKAFLCNHALSNAPVELVTTPSRPLLPAFPPFAPSLSSSISWTCLLLLIPLTNTTTMSHRLHSPLNASSPVQIHSNKHPHHPIILAHEHFNAVVRSANSGYHH
jgi:hypothetical protein